MASHNDREPVPVRIAPSDIPGLYDVEFSDGTVHELTHGQVRAVTDTVEWPR